jgi:hypothetical protein
LRAILLDPVDLRGLPAVVDGRAIWAEPAFLPNAERDGERGILFLDELNAAPASVQAACFQLVLDRRLGEYVLPAGWRIVAAGNRQTDRAAAQRMPTPLANRMAHLDCDPDPETWQSWARAANVNPMVRAFLRFRPALFHVMEGTDLRAFPTPRSWTQVAKIADQPEDMLHALTAGLVGQGPAAEFVGFVRIYRELPDIAEIFAHPATAPVPTQPAALYAISTAIARLADLKSMAAVVTYADRLPREFSVLTIVDAVKRNPSLCETAAFVSWAQANQDVTL